MQKYFVRIDGTYQPKNKLHEAVLEHVKRIDQALISNLDAYKKTIKEAVEKYNKAFPRCKPCEVQFWKQDNKNYRLQVRTGSAMDEFVLVYVNVLAVLMDHTATTKKKGGKNVSLS